MPVVIFHGTSSSDAGIPVALKDIDILSITSKVEENKASIQKVKSELEELKQQLMTTISIVTEPITPELNVKLKQQEDANATSSMQPARITTMKAPLFFDL